MRSIYKNCVCGVSQIELYLYHKYNYICGCICDTRHSTHIRTNITQIELYLWTNRIVFVIRMCVECGVSQIQPCVMSQIQLSLYEWGGLGMRPTNVCHAYNWVCTIVCHVTHTIESLRMCVISQIHWSLYEWGRLGLRSTNVYDKCNWVCTIVCHITHTIESLRMCVMSRIQLSLYDCVS